MLSEGCRYANTYVLPMCIIVCICVYVKKYACLFGYCLSNCTHDLLLGFKAAIFFDLSYFSIYVFIGFPVEGPSCRLSTEFEALQPYPRHTRGEHKSVSLQRPGRFTGSNTCPFKGDVCKCESVQSDSFLDRRQW